MIVDESSLICVFVCYYMYYLKNIYCCFDEAICLDLVLRQGMARVTS